MSRTLFATGFATLLLSSVAVAAIGQEPTAPLVAVALEAAPAAGVIDAFHAALKVGDTDKALALLAEDVVIFEEGGAERSRDEYAAHHLEADASFAAVSEAAMTRRSGWADGDIAWVMSEGRTTGLSGDRTIDRMTVETMVLKRGSEGWRIKHIHWSSQAAPDA